MALYYLHLLHPLQNLLSPSTALATNVSTVVSSASTLPFDLNHRAVEERRSEVRLSSVNVHRLLLASLLVSAKYFDDHHLSNSIFGQIGGVPVTELCALESRFLALVQFRLFVQPDHYARFYQFMAQLPCHRLAPSLACTSTSISKPPTPCCCAAYLPFYIDNVAGLNALDAATAVAPSTSLPCVPIPLRPRPRPTCLPPSLARKLKADALACPEFAFHSIRMTSAVSCQPYPVQQSYSDQTCYRTLRKPSDVSLPVVQTHETSSMHPLPVSSAGLCLPTLAGRVSRSGSGSGSIDLLRKSVKTTATAVTATNALGKKPHDSIPTSSPSSQQQREIVSANPASVATLTTGLHAQYPGAGAGFATDTSLSRAVLIRSFQARHQQRVLGSSTAKKPISTAPTPMVVGAAKTVETPFVESATLPVIVTATPTASASASVVTPSPSKQSLVGPSADHTPTSHLRRLVPSHHRSAIREAIDKLFR